MPVIAPGVKQKGSISGLDAGGELGSVSFWLPVLTAGNAAAKAALWATVVTTWQDLFLMNIARDQYLDLHTYNPSRPGDGAAREISLKLIARSGATGQTVNYYCPGINIAAISYIPNYGGKDIVDLASTDLAPFIAALNAMPLINPYDASYTDTMTIVGAAVVRGQK